MAESHHSNSKRPKLAPRQYDATTTDEPIASTSDGASVADCGVASTSGDFSMSDSAVAGSSRNCGVQQTVSVTGCSAGRDLHVNINISNNESGSAPSVMSPLEYGLPLCVDKVVGRDTAVKELHELLMTEGGSKRVVITGMGGVGKTTLAYHCARLWHSQSLIKNIAVLNAETIDSFQNSVTDLAAHLNIETKNKLLETVRRICDHFKGSDVLLVYDNLVPYDIVNHYLPDSPHMYILATSQCTELSAFFTPYPLECLETQAGMQLVQHILPSVSFHEVEILELVQTLGGLPLALQHAAAYILDAMKYENAQFTARDYLQQYKDYLDKEVPEDFRNNNKTTVYKTLMMNVEKVKQERSKTILYCMAFLDPTYIKIELFYNHFKQNSFNIFRELTKYSLIKFSERYGTKYFDIHRLVQEICRGSCDKSIYIQLVIKILIKSRSSYYHFKTLFQHVDSHSAIMEYTTRGFKNAFENGDLLDELTKHLKSLDLEASIRSKWSIWEWAAYTGCNVMLEYFNEIKLEYSDNTSGWTPLHAACLNDKCYIADLLPYIPENIINVQTREGLTALHIVAARGDVYMIRELIELGCEINSRDNKGNTALHWACINHCSDAMQKLIDWDIKIGIKNNKEQMALQLHNQECIIELGDNGRVKGFEKLIIFRIISPSGEPLRKALIALEMFKDCQGEEYIDHKLKHCEWWDETPQTFVKELVEKLHGSYLAIAMVTAYIIEEGLTVAGALNMLTENQSHPALEKIMNICGPEAHQYKQVFLVICLTLDKVKERNVKVFNWLLYRIYFQDFYKSLDEEDEDDEIIIKCFEKASENFCISMKLGDLEKCIQCLIKFLLMESRDGRTIMDRLVQNIVHVYNSDTAQEITNNVLGWYVRGFTENYSVLGIMGVKDIAFFLSTSDLLKETICMYERTGCRVTNSDKWSLLHRACADGGKCTEIVDRLTELKVDVNLQVDGIAPIHLLPFTDSTCNCIHSLRRAGADLSVKTNEGWTALHFAAFLDNWAAVEYLMHEGAGVHAVTNDGETALDIATRLGHTDIVDRIKRQMNKFRR